MPHQGRRPERTRESSEALSAYARRLARTETVTRVACLVVGLAFAFAAVFLFVVVLRLGPRAAFGAILGALFLGIPAAFLLRRALTGRDVDRYDVDDLSAHHRTFRWW